MAFSFGNSSQSTFGSSAPKPTGFGTAFGANPTTTAPTSFGFGSTFGANTQQAPAFGSSAPQATAFGSSTPQATAFGSSTPQVNAFGSSGQQTLAFGSTFGTPAVGTTAPTFGSTFGTPASSAAPTFGTGFGTPATSTAPAFGTSFGAPVQQSTGLFGSTTTKSSLFGTTSAPSLFSTPATGTTSLFGTGTQPTGLFGNSTMTTSTPLFGTTTTPSLFGQPATTSAPSLFGSATPGFGLFGTGTTTSAPSLFGSSFGNTTTTTGFGGLNTGFGFSGTNFGGGSLFGPKPQVQISVPPVSITQNVLASVYAINAFNDERDDILKKWNMLQACWGTGKGYFHSSMPPMEYTPQNPFYRFKAIGYNIIPEQDNSEGIVKLIFNKKISELKSLQEVLKNGIAGILGNKPNLSVDVTYIKALSDTQTEVKITVTEKGVTGTGRKIPASDLSAYLNQPTQKQQLSNVGVIAITPFVTPSKAELEEYLKHPPPGIEMQMWQAAIQDNPNPKKYIPVPINGFSDLHARMLHQEYQTGLHQAFLEKVNKEITELKTKHSSSIAQISELKQRYLELQHRILRVLVKQESTRKVGIAIQPEEELLRGRFEMMHAQLNNPKQFKGQVNELLSNVKMMDGSQKQNHYRYRIDADAQEEIKQLLKMEQGGISQLINIINNDLQALNIINKDMSLMLATVPKTARF